MGSLFGARLASVGHEVVLLGREAHVRAIRERGLLVTGLTEAVVNLEAVSCLDELPDRFRPDYILVTVKAYDTPAAACGLSTWRGIGAHRDEEGTGPAVVSLQNGLDNLTRLASTLGFRRLLGGLTSYGAIFRDWGHVHHAGTGYTVVGEYRRDPDGSDGSAPSPLLKGLADSLDQANLDTSITDDLAGQVWAKGIVNCAINPVTAITGTPNRGLAKDPLRELARRACHEAVKVAGAAGVKLPDTDPWKRVARVIEETADNRSSMLQNLERGRRTEVEAINGAVVKLGEVHGVPTPVNRTLWRLVEGLRTIS